MNTFSPISHVGHNLMLLDNKDDIAATGGGTAYKMMK
jgi:hypothetical protein